MRGIVSTKIRAGRASINLSTQRRRTTRVLRGRASFNNDGAGGADAPLTFRFSLEVISGPNIIAVFFSHEIGPHITWALQCQQKIARPAGLDDVSENKCA